LSELGKVSLLLVNDGGLTTMKQLSDIPHGLRSVYRRFQYWRNKHPQSRLPIPKRLWLAAAEAARGNGVGKTAQALGLDYGKLKRLAESGTAAAATRTTPPTFVELIGSQGDGLSECLIELEGPQGKMRIQWKGATNPDLAGLSRVLWERK
jgi:hypothetical protein